ncbi:hypothetical protein TGME49_216840 [Toxoplasma gondii ME49]|uniref:Uncharacterized protein n=5 Tax=Toxoplasma gondii TaxID=5811 RepID=A0A0F7V5W5_TOXGV|nr:hypothetical protein TGME49_216840 [Toxoplasma gondii ME49]ESS28774.1 hypothetical protein TGVEG_216840 [Toxoplasma gondii VEG]KFG32416.1 hypothetical protein TGDOM2_216840 [Toxoplasma gondii GAB2-2007-GAL-DOM2]KFG41222.1 hypothetical protein TGFOU_216840 [Toxoplasma gondii FOU]PUA83905.1 hypothetical protein TGBR9_216840 [Toxoplasma gondii TgCATBr9]EPT25592.1 hypothetical protein TGME49_216840 [Toxoplasma gondii ME49]|eukprot:XP_018635267.1 hypothetical protein TGME49_216840 [Toxoplasma gondii ME49]
MSRLAPLTFTSAPAAAPPPPSAHPPDHGCSTGSAAALRASRRKHLLDLRGAEEELQFLAGRVLQSAGPPHMLPLAELCTRMVALDAACVSRGLLHLTRGLAKALGSSRSLFVGSRKACEERIEAQRQEEERRRDTRRAAAEAEKAKRRATRSRNVEAGESRLLESTKREAFFWSEARSACEDPTGTNGQPDSVCGSPRFTDTDASDDEVEWFNAPVRDEESSCFPWLAARPVSSFDGAQSPRFSEAHSASADALLAPSAGPAVGFSSAQVSSTSSDIAAPTAEATAAASEESGELYVLLQPVPPAEEALGHVDVVVLLCSFLEVGDIISLGRVCRGTVEATLRDEVWLPLLQRKFPKASLVDEDVLNRADQEKQLDEQQQKEIVDALLVRFPPDSPTSLPSLLLAANEALSQIAVSRSNCVKEANTSMQASHEKSLSPKARRLDAEGLLHLLSLHGELFKQDAEGEKFCVNPSAVYSDWGPVNPYAAADWTAEKRKKIEEELATLRGETQGTSACDEDKAESESPDNEYKQLGFRRDLTARQAYRLWHTQLLGFDQTRERPWEYKSESNRRGTLPAGHLLDLCERRVRFVRREDPAAVHTLTVLTLEGVAFHIRDGCFNRRVNILQQALCSAHLRIERETRKRFERKLLDLMQFVRGERKFGFYQCRACGARWRSGFTYEEISQQCLRCGLWSKAFRVQTLLSHVAGGPDDPGAPRQSDQSATCHNLLHARARPGASAGAGSRQESSSVPGGRSCGADRGLLAATGDPPLEGVEGRQSEGGSRQFASTHVSASRAQKNERLHARASPAGSHQPDRQPLLPTGSRSRGGFRGADRQSVHFQSNRRGRPEASQGRDSLHGLFVPPSERPVPRNPLEGLLPDPPHAVQARGLEVPRERLRGAEKKPRDPVASHRGNVNARVRRGNCGHARSEPPEAKLERQTGRARGTYAEGADGGGVRLSHRNVRGPGATGVNSRSHFAGHGDREEGFGNLTRADAVSKVLNQQNQRSQRHGAGSQDTNSGERMYGWGRK